MLSMIQALKRPPKPTVQEPAVSTSETQIVVEASQEKDKDIKETELK